MTARRQLDKTFADLEEIMELLSNVREPGARLGIPVVLGENVVDGIATLSADINLAALTDGDYVIGVDTVAAGATAVRFVAIRVVR